MAHAAAGGRGLSGDETDHRLLHVFLYIRGGQLFGVAADFADHDDGVGVGVVVEELDGVGVGGADDGVASDADTGRLADVEIRQLADGFVGKCAGARDHAHVAREVNVPGHDADLALAGSDDAGAVGSDQARRGVRLQIFPGLDHVVDGDAFGDADDQGESGVGSFHDGVGGEGRRHEDDGGVRAGGFDAFGDGVEYRTIEVLLATFAGSDSAHYIGAVGDGLLGVEGSFLAGESLH